MRGWHKCACMHARPARARVRASHPPAAQWVPLCAMHGLGGFRRCRGLEGRPPTHPPAPSAPPIRPPHLLTHPPAPMQACVVFFDEVDAIGGARFDDGAGGDNEVQRTMLEIVNQLDGFDARGNVKVGAERGCRTWVQNVGHGGGGQSAGGEALWW